MNITFSTPSAVWRIQKLVTLEITQSVHFAIVGYVGEKEFPKHSKLTDLNFYLHFLAYEEGLDTEIKKITHWLKEKRIWGRLTTQDINEVIRNFTAFRMSVKLLP